MAEYQFYLVWRDGGGAPVVKHFNFADARIEAERLARLNPGVRYYVVTAESYAECTQPVQWIVLAEEVPF